jgi:type I restriction enzyme S subunit
MINLKSFTQEGEYRPEGIKFHNGKFKKESFIKPNEIVIANTCQTRGGELLGAAVMIPSNFHGKQVIGSHHTTILTITHDSVIPRYILHVLNSPRVREKVKQYKRGALIQGILTSDLKKIMIKIPPLEEQEKIAAILDKADEIKRESEIAHAMRDSMVRSSFLERFGDVRINNHNHPTMNLGDFCDIVNGSTPSSKEDSYWGGDIPWVSPVTLSKLEEPWLREPTRFITEEGYGSCSTTMVEEDSILFSSRAPIGLVAIASMPVCTNQGFKTLTGFREHATPEYMYQLMKELGDSIASRGRGATFTEINKSIMASIEVPIPPLTEQRRFSSIFKAIYNNREMSYLSLQYAVTMSDSLVQELMT